MAGHSGSECCHASSGTQVSRRALLRWTGAIAGGVALSGMLPRAIAAAEAPGEASVAAQAAGVVVRWLGGGVVEVSTADGKQIAYIDAWVWRNDGWDRFGAQKPPEYASAAGFAEYVRGRSPEAVLVMLSHDHGDHMTDFFEMLAALSAAGVNVKATGQSDLMRAGLVPRFRDAGLDPAQIVVNGGAGMNFGGRSRFGAIQTILIPAIHSTLAGYPAAGFIFDIGGVRFYASGDTDLFGDMRLIGERYRPEVALICSGDGPFTMGPRDAALACQYLGVSRAFPIHYAHNAAVLGPQAGEDFRQAAAELVPGMEALVLTPGQSTTLGA